MKNRTRSLLAALAWCLIPNLPPATAVAQGTAFAYQGQLQNNGSLASGTYNLQFTLYTNSTGGTAAGGPVTNSAVAVTNGLFTVTIDFGSSVWNGQTNWLQIGVASNNIATFTPLTPRQELTPVPYAIYSEGGNAAGLSGTIPAVSLPTAVLTNGSSNVVLSGQFNGNGSGLTNLNGGSIQSGTVGAPQLTTGIGTIPSGALVLSSTENNAALTNAGFALLVGAIQGITWNAATDAASWAPRSDLQGLAFGNQLWVLGGENQSFTALGDIWSSSNGIAWTEATSAAPWGARDDFGAAVLGNQMWVMGGVGTFLFNDVWSSTNGINWAEATNAAPWTERFALGAVAFSNQLWIMGGTSNGTAYFNDVWSSSNGVAWKEATNAAAWAPRGYFGCAVMNGQMYVMGGFNNSVAFDDVWASSNGTTWTELTNAAPWGQRYGFGVVPASGQLWVMGGLNGSSMETSDVWASSNGLSWIEVTNAAPWGPRIVFGDVTLSNQIWLLGGYSAGNVTNDVWFSPATAPGMVGGYYLYQKQ